MRGKLPQVLLALYIFEFVALGIDPYSRGVWIAGNIPIVLIVLFLAASYRRFKFSNTSYVLMSVLVFLHTIGGYYTFERVPFGFVTELFGFTRNHYDRIAHFSVGFYAYPIAEYLYRKGLTASKGLPAFTGITSIFKSNGGTRLPQTQPPASPSWAARATSGTRRRTCWPTGWGLSAPRFSSCFPSRSGRGGNESRA